MGRQGALGHLPCGRHACQIVRQDQQRLLRGEIGSAPAVSGASEAAQARTLDALTLSPQGERVMTDLVTNLISLHKVSVGAPDHSTTITRARPTSDPYPGLLRAVSTCVKHCAVTVTQTCVDLKRCCRQEGRQGEQDVLEPWSPVRLKQAFLKD